MREAFETLGDPERRKVRRPVPVFSALATTHLLSGLRCKSYGGHRSRSNFCWGTTSNSRKDNLGATSPRETWEARCRTQGSRGTRKERNGDSSCEKAKGSCFSYRNAPGDPSLEPRIYCKKTGCPSGGIHILVFISYLLRCITAESREGTSRNGNAHNTSTNPVLLNSALDRLFPWFIHFIQSFYRDFSI